MTFSDGKSNCEGLDDIQFLLKYFKPRCSQCFISHTPRNKWCEKQKMKTKKKNEDMVKGILHEIIEVSVKESERKVKIFHVESILDDVINKSVEESDAKYSNIRNILGNIIDNVVNRNCTTHENLNDNFSSRQVYILMSIKMVLSRNLALLWIGS